MSDPSSFINDKHDSIQHAPGTLPSSLRPILHPDEKKSMTIEIEADAHPDLTHYIFECQQRAFHWNEFLELAQSINSEDQFKRYLGLVGIRKLLSNLTLCIS